MEALARGGLGGIVWGAPTFLLLKVTTLNPAAADRPGDDLIFALDAEARRRAAAGEQVVNATLGALLRDDGTLAVLPSVAEALQRALTGRSCGYAPILGTPDFRRAVVQDVFGDGPTAAATIACATPGGTGALYQAITNFLAPGQSLLTTSFYWGPYQTLAEHSGRRLATFPMFTNAGGLDVDAFAAALHGQLAAQGRALVFLNTPCHNPTGYSFDDGEWDAIAGVVQRAGEQAPVTVLIDLAYERFAAAGSADWTRHLPRMNASATVLVAWSASKAFTQYGARIGAILATHEDAAERARLSSAFAFGSRGTWSNCNHLGQLAITDLLTSPALRARTDTERAELKALLAERVAVFNTAAARHGLRYPRYEGGFFVSVFTQDPKGTAARLREGGVFVVPIGDDQGGAVRIGLCATPADAVERLVAALARAMTRTPRPQPPA